MGMFLEPLQDSQPLLHRALQLMNFEARTPPTFVSYG
jgi:hypothetical protein